jgi:DUF4097 and DUF4098 domain-containing protein YvlB
MAWLIPVAALGLSAALAAQDLPLTREGPYWVRTLEGTVEGAPQPRLQVFGRGHIVLKGGPGEQVTYRVQQRVRARSEQEAERLLGNLTATSRSVSGITRLVVTPTSVPIAATEIEIRVPRYVSAAEVQSQMGGLEAYDLEGSVTAMTAGGAISLDRIMGSVNGRTGGGEIRLGKIGGMVRCVTGAGSILVESSGGETNCATAGGNIIVREAGGPLTLTTEGGSIQVDRAASTVEAHSAAGLIQVGQAGGTVIANTQGGSIDISSARGVRAESAAGAVRVKSVTGPVNVSTLAGNILAELLAGARVQDSSFVVGSGDITLMIPSNLAVSVMASNAAGAAPRIVSEFPEIHVNSLAFKRPPLIVQGAINGGGPLLRLNAAGGVIYLRRVK